MSTAAPSTLEDVIRQSGEGWLIDWYAPREKAMSHIRKTLDAVSQVARQRLGGNAPDLSEAALVQEFNRRPNQVRAFFQAMGGTRNPEMLLMAWRIIQGMEVQEITISYTRDQSFEMRVILNSPYDDGHDQPYQSHNIHDFALFRHVGFLEVSGRPVFSGFYALRLEEP